MNELIRKIKSMKPSEHIQNMVDGLKNPFTHKVKMYSFGHTETKKLFFGLLTVHIYYGCAATNAIGRLLEKPHEWLKYREYLMSDANNFFFIYERAIDALRKGDIKLTNKLFFEIGIPPIRLCNIILPALKDDYTKKQLLIYEKLAKFNYSLLN